MHSAEARGPLDVDLLRRALTGSGGRWRCVEVVSETGSTNADLLARAAAGDDIDGAVLFAEHQTAGRGRHGRQWSAPPRSQLALSVGVTAADVPARTWGWLPLATGLAVVDAVEAVTGISAGLKWPNDVLAAGGKLAGVLAEVAAPKPTVVVGLGLNVAMTATEMPDPAATSLAVLGASVTDRNTLAVNVLGQLSIRIADWCRAADGDSTLARDYCSRSLTLGTRVRASMPGDHNVEGIAEGIDELGRLCIRTATEVVTVSAGDIIHLRTP